MSYALLLLTVISDMMATLFLKLSSGLSRVSFVILAMLLFVASKCFFGLCLEKLPLSYAYAVWCGLGTLIAALLSRYYFGEPLNLIGWIGLVLILSGIGLMKF